MLTQTDTTSVNGSVFKSVYDASQKQLTLTSQMNRQTIIISDVIWGQRSFRDKTLRKER